MLSSAVNIFKGREGQGQRRAEMGTDVEMGMEMEVEVEMEVEGDASRTGPRDQCCIDYYTAGEGLDRRSSLKRATDWDVRLRCLRDPSGSYGMCERVSEQVSE